MMPPVYILIDSTYGSLRAFFDLEKAKQTGIRMRPDHGQWSRGYHKWTRGAFQEIREVVVE